MRIIIAALFALSLIACQNGGTALPPRTKTDIINGLTALQESINLTVQMSSVALKHGGIDWRQACRVDQATRLASSLVKQAFLTVNNDIDSADSLLEAAKDAANGVGNQVEALVNQNCLERTS